ncbi:MAG: 2-C-methyl-D-erythritol 4-phosphate cytidylyltransferase [Acidimicrobiia bacterium]
MWGLVVAAGAGSRFGAAKQFASLAGRRVVDWSVGTARSACEAVVVVLPADHVWDGPPVAAAVPGGDSRSDSVRAGLAVIPAGAEIVVVHDAARPLAPSALFGAVIDAVRAGADGAVPALAVPDTVKRVDGDRVMETLDRSALVLVQTPQAFRADVLRAALAGGAQATDEAALVELAGGKVVTVPGDPLNLKITTPHDLARAGWIMREL